MSMQSQHIQTVVNEFSTQAAIWSGSVPSSLVELVSSLEFKSDDTVIDVAAGSCRVSRAIAPLVSEVTAVEITQAMLEQGRKAAVQEGLSNIAFQVGTAESLPVESSQFDVAITRYSFHHFTDAQKVLTEMVRVTKPNGRVIVIDILSPHDENLAYQYNHYQRMRDPSHTHSPQLALLQEWYQDEGIQVTHCQTTSETQALDDWLQIPSLSDDTKGQIRNAVTAELEGGPATGLIPFWENGTIYFREQVITIIGQTKSEI
ncbi:MAG: methyltransferase domain-containing protein [Chloroflexota bacterium]